MRPPNEPDLAWASVVGVAEVQVPADRAGAYEANGDNTTVGGTALGTPPSTAFLLFSAYRAIETRIVTALRRAGFADLTPAQARVFRCIPPSGFRLTELADAAGVTKQTAGFLVDQLARTGYVRRVADPGDARARLVKIAPKGAAVIPIALSVIAETEAEWATNLGRDEMAGLRSTLESLAVASAR